MGRERKASVSGRCCRRVKKGIEEERDRMREKEGGGEKGLAGKETGKEGGIEVWRGFLLVVFSLD